MAFPQMVATGMQAKGKGRKLEQSEYPEKNMIFIGKNIFNEYFKRLFTKHFLSLK
ncbi:hypothetical protein [Paenibacillus dendritiformis]|uniref:hypothetical protein n=1 Tax=Paenibacillus dendritiformis TaxID=130049 RepID=UPI0015EBBF92|nr:hypothetical protein [Paenibacillus dendritiformis]